MEKKAMSREEMADKLTKAGPGSYGTSALLMGPG